MELPEDSCWLTSLIGMSMDGPTGKPAGPARACRLARLRAGFSATKVGFGPEGRKKLKMAAVPTTPTGVPVQLLPGKMVANTPGKSIRAIPPPLGLATQLPGVPVPSGAAISRGLVPGVA